MSRGVLRGELLEKLREKGLPPHEAEQLLEAVLGISRSMLLLSRGEVVSESLQKQVLEWAERRLQGEPLQYLTGFQVFRSHCYRVAPGVLVPRPETECLLEQAVFFLNQFGVCFGPATVGMEVGVGTGVLSIELLSEFSGLSMLASDASEVALEVALHNAKQLLQISDLKRLQLLHAPDPLKIWEPFFSAKKQGAFLQKASFLISNPPYLDPSLGEFEVSSEVCLHEPPLALFPQHSDPSFFYTQWAQTPESLWEVFFHPGSFLFLEVPHPRAEAIQGLFQSPLFKMHGLFPDLTGRSRVLVVQLQMK